MTCKKSCGLEGVQAASEKVNVRNCLPSICPASFQEADPPRTRRRILQEAAEAWSGARRHAVRGTVYLDVAGIAVDSHVLGAIGAVAEDARRLAAGDLRLADLEPAGLPPWPVEVTRGWRANPDRPSASTPSEGAPKSTADAVAWSIATFGEAGLVDPDKKRRLRELSSRQRQDVAVRLHRARDRWPALTDKLLRALTELADER
jgi:hypothetical protein